MRIERLECSVCHIVTDSREYISALEICTDCHVTGGMPDVRGEVT